MYTLFTEKKVSSVTKTTEPVNLASKLRGEWMCRVIPSAVEGKLLLGTPLSLGGTHTP